MDNSSVIAGQTLKYLLLTQALVLAPLVLQIPYWLSALALVIMVWRWLLHQGRGFYPGKISRALLAIAVSALLFASFNGRFGMETMVSLLVAGFVLKLTEARSRSHVYLLCFLAYFVIGTQLLFYNQLLGMLYSLSCFAAVTATLLVNQAARGEQGGFKPWRRLTGMLLQAVPIMLVLFLAVPRIGSLWTVPLNNGSGITGLSDSMSPGDMANLMQSDEVAFRASFAGAIPAPQQRYWRALVLDHFDGRRWSQGRLQDVKAGRGSIWQDAAQELEPLGERVEYQVMLEPSSHNWLYSLALAQPSASDIHLSRGFTLFQRRPVSQRKQYSLVSALDFRAQADGLSDWERRSALQLPDTGNLQTRQLARQWSAQAASPQDLVDRFLRYVQSRFHYTLQPPLLGEDSVDEFLLQSQTGFCEHFAGSFVFFMRAAGVPARVVTGYQGGKVNPHEGYLTVRQLDAHAWAEVWLAGRGWMRVDPTAAVAPERIDRGVEFSLDDTDSQLLGNALGRRFALLANWQLHWDAFNYRWHRWVMGYDAQAQQQFLSALLGGNAAWRSTLAIIAAVAVIILLLAIALFWQRRAPVATEVRIYQRLCRTLAGLGLPRGAGEGPHSFARRVAQAHPDLAEDFDHLSQLFERIRFADDQSAAAEFRHLARAFSRKLSRRSPH
ncbi:DUF3488 and transglutaminase-like domain-containing protein [Gilvimarinus sp. DA14]|uniref:transglutaminase TgpA family protein n=1 Tax=Gilvimarinus sp. DA14 TaxID=2956798 RepID=UPI0020B6D54F|nr:DUF3488 and transglutaminase-like domain-containing protein [Gilvimarinus sp. DA14]UTF60975.1 DUF3488 and transglutaminase-like domain-containing protein [Gilvimarinus sp. DA14]